MLPVLGSPTPKTAYHPLELLARRGGSQDEIVERLGLTLEEVVAVRQRLRLLNWVIVGAAYELVRQDRGLSTLGHRAECSAEWRQTTGGVAHDVRMG